MLNNKSLLQTFVIIDSYMRDEQGVVPGLRGSSTSESYEGQRDHPFYMSYLRGEYGEPVGVQIGEIMQRWVRVPIVSEGYNSCYPVIAVNIGEAQMIHMSRDPWRPTNTDEYWQRLREWQRLGCDVTLLRVMRSALLGKEDEQLQELFGSKFLDLDLGEIDSRFGLVFDVKKRLLLVQLTDTKEMKKFQI